jgi:hypothetical protein
MHATSLTRLASLTVWRRALLAVAALCGACHAGDSSPVVDPTDADQASLRLEQVVFTQVVQDDAGSLPLVAGSPAAAIVLITRSKESVAQVPIVLRLYRGAQLVYSDTTLTGGVLSKVRSLARPSAEFLIPASLIAADVSWQVAIDPGNTVPDSSRADNVLPANGPAAIVTVNVPPLHIRLVPVILIAHGNITGDVSAANAETYVRLARQIFPAREITVTIGAPITTLANFGSPPSGADRPFWDSVLLDIDRARDASGTRDQYWYGVVPIPPGYSRLTFGGLGYVPESPSLTGPGSRSGVGMDILSTSSAFAQEALAHELGHNLGRVHAPGCNAVEPIDPVFRGTGGSIASTGHDVWSWVNHVSIGAQSVGADTPDIMTYCAAPRWIGAYNYAAVLQWRLAGAVSARTTAPRVVVALP